MPSKLKIKNLSDLRYDLVAVYESMRNGEMEADEGVKYSKVAGQIINSLKVDLMRDDQLRIVSEIDFIDQTRTRMVNGELPKPKKLIE
jgi:hypothetical protein